jgi:hypothetical protein
MFSRMFSNAVLSYVFQDCTFFFFTNVIKKFSLVNFLLFSFLDFLLNDRYAKFFNCVRFTKPEKMRSLRNTSKSATPTERSTVLRYSTYICTEQKFLYGPTLQQTFSGHDIPWEYINNLEQNHFSECTFLEIFL